MQVSDDFEYKDFEITETFDLNFSNSKIDENPFAEDFKEEKFISQM